MIREISLEHLFHFMKTFILTFPSAYLFMCFFLSISFLFFFSISPFSYISICIYVCMCVYLHIHMLTHTYMNIPNYSIFVRLKIPNWLQIRYWLEIFRLIKYPDRKLTGHCLNLTVFFFINGEVFFLGKSSLFNCYGNFWC